MKEGYQLIVAEEESRIRGDLVLVRVVVERG